MQFPAKGLSSLNNLSLRNLSTFGSSFYSCLILTKYMKHTVINLFNPPDDLDMVICISDKDDTSLIYAKYFPHHCFALPYLYIQSVHHSS